MVVMMMMMMMITDNDYDDSDDSDYDVADHYLVFNSTITYVYLYVTLRIYHTV